MSLKLSNIKIEDQDTTTFAINHLGLVNLIDNQLNNHSWSLMKIDDNNQLSIFQLQDRDFNRSQLCRFITTDFQQISHQVKMINWLKSWQAKLDKINYHASKQHLQIVHRVQDLTYRFNFNKIDNLTKMNYYCLIAWIFIDAKTEINQALETYFQPFKIQDPFNIQDPIANKFIISISNDLITISFNGFQKSFTNQAFAKVLATTNTWLTNYLTNQNEQKLNTFVNFLTDSSWMQPKHLTIQLIDLYFKNQTFLVDNKCYYLDHTYQLALKNATIKFTNPDCLLINSNRQLDQSIITTLNWLANILAQQLLHPTITFWLNETKTFNVHIKDTGLISNRYEKIIGERSANYRFLIRHTNILNIPYHINLKTLKTNFKPICWLINNVKDKALYQIYHYEKINPLPKIHDYRKLVFKHKKKDYYKWYYNDDCDMSFVKTIDNNYNFDLSIVDGFALLTSVEKYNGSPKNKKSYVLQNITSDPAIKKQLQKIKPWIT